MRAPLIKATLASMGLAALFLTGCGSSGGGDDATTTSTTAATTTTVASTTTGVAVTTTVASSTTAAGGGASTTVTEPSNGLKPGEACSMEEGSPDCIDPDGDGNGTYLIGGAACIANQPDPSLCTDLDGDGYAGYPDSE